MWPTARLPSRHVPLTTSAALTGVLGVLLAFWANDDDDGGHPIIDFHLIRKFT